MTNKKWKDNNLLNLNGAEERYAPYLKANYKKEAEKVKKVLNLLDDILYNENMTEFYDTNEDFILAVVKLRNLFETLYRKGVTPTKAEEEKPYDGQLIYIKYGGIGGKVGEWIKNDIETGFPKSIKIHTICIYHNDNVFVFRKHRNKELNDLFHKKYNDENTSFKRSFSEQEMDLLEDIKTGVYLDKIIPWEAVKEWLPAEECSFPSAEPFGANNIKNCVQKVKNGEYDIFLKGNHKNGPPL